MEGLRRGLMPYGETIGAILPRNSKLPLIMVFSFLLLLSDLTLFAYINPILAPVIGLAWDCGAVTTGPVTVLLVLALGIGVCRIVGDDDGRGAGFGIVTLASVFPIVAVLLLELFHYGRQDYHGAKNHLGDFAISAETPLENSPLTLQQDDRVEDRPRFTEEELKEYAANGILRTIERYAAGQIGR